MPTATWEQQADRRAADGSLEVCRGVLQPVRVQSGHRIDTGCGGYESDPELQDGRSASGGARRENDVGRGRGRDVGQLRGCLVGLRRRERCGRSNPGRGTSECCREPRERERFDHRHLRHHHNVGGPGGGHATLGFHRRQAGDGLQRRRRNRKCLGRRNRRHGGQQYPQLARGQLRLDGDPVCLAARQSRPDGRRRADEDGLASQ